MSNLSQKLKNRHIQMIALGGVIGTGLFFGAAKSIQATGPSITLAYLLGGLLIYIILRALGEMTVFNPSSGSFSDYAQHYIGDYLGFIAGWTAWFEYTVVCMVELTVVSIFLDYWIPGVPHWLVCLGLLIVFTSIQLISVKLFGEFEFWFAGIKIAVIILMLILTAYLVLFNPIIQAGSIKNLTSYANWDVFFAGGIKGFLFSLVIVTFSFGGSEFVSIAAGEAENPEKSIPKAIRGVIVRIILFYILTIIAILCLYPFNKLNPNLSPFVDVFREIGLKSAANFMNLVAITAALSAFNSCLYAANRMLFGLARRNQASQKLVKLNRFNIPSYSIIATAACILLAVVINYIFPEKAFMYLLVIATCSILICWFIILITQLRFRSYSIKNNLNLKYRLILFPYTNYFALGVLILVMIVMLFMPDMRLSVLVAPFWVLFLSAFYWLRKKRNMASTNTKEA